MDLIERYIYLVTENLPEDIREDVSKELRGNIEDMLPDNATESDIHKVLEELGNPSVLSKEYSDGKKFLIGPSLYDNYIVVLKLVLSIVAIVFATISIFEVVMKSPTNEGLFILSLNVIVNIIESVMVGLIQGALWVTIVFVVLERVGINEGKLPYVKKKWTPDDLNKIDMPTKGKISRGETIFSMFCIIFFTSLLTLRPELIGIYYKGEGGFKQATPLLDANRLEVYIPAILLLAVFALCILVWKLISLRWNLSLGVTNAIYNLSVIILMYTMVKDETLINEMFFSKFANFVNLSVSELMIQWDRGTTIFALVFIIISIIDSVMGFVKAIK